MSCQSEAAIVFPEALEETFIAACREVARDPKAWGFTRDPLVDSADRYQAEGMVLYHWVPQRLLDWDAVLVEFRSLLEARFKAAGTPEEDPYDHYRALRMGESFGDGEDEGNLEAAPFNLGWTWNLVFEA